MYGGGGGERTSVGRQGRRRLGRHPVQVCVWRLGGGDWILAPGCPGCPQGKLEEAGRWPGQGRWRFVSRAQGGKDERGQRVRGVGCRQEDRGCRAALERAVLWPWITWSLG